MNPLPITIVIIDDDLLYSQIITVMLEKKGMIVLFHASNGKIGVEMIAGCSSQPQIVIVDIEMPVMDGFETIRFLQQTMPDLVTIVHSSLGDAQIRERIMTDGARAFVLKHSTAELIETIQKLANSIKK